MRRVFAAADLHSERTRARLALCFAWHEERDHAPPFLQNCPLTARFARSSAIH
jgi:hypothetical protein